LIENHRKRGADGERDCGERDPPVVADPAAHTVCKGAERKARQRHPYGVIRDRKGREISEERLLVEDADKDGNGGNGCDAADGDDGALIGKAKRGSAMGREAEDVVERSADQAEHSKPDHVETGRADAGECQHRVHRAETNTVGRQLDVPRQEPPAHDQGDAGQRDHPEHAGLLVLGVIADPQDLRGDIVGGCHSHVAGDRALGDLVRHGRAPALREGPTAGA
jgi:hypothetical protein